jgi:hypothetical protein
MRTDVRSAVRGGAGGGGSGRSWTRRVGAQIPERHMSRAGQGSSPGSPRISRNEDGPATSRSKTSRGAGDCWQDARRGPVIDVSDIGSPLGYVTGCGVGMARSVPRGGFGDLRGGGKSVLRSRRTGERTQSEKDG